MHNSVFPFAFRPQIHYEITLSIHESMYFLNDELNYYIVLCMSLKRWVAEAAHEQIEALFTG